MSSDHESIQQSSTKIFAALRDVCAALYPEERDTRVVVADAGLDEREITFSARAQTNWHNILAEAIRCNRLDLLLAVARTAYPTNQPLQTAIANYHALIKAGGQLDAPAQLPAGVDPYDVHGLTNPYLGLRAFRYDDRAIYAGREQLAHETVQRLTNPGAPQTVLFITGASGSGKSSFAQAGLIPLLENHYTTYQKTVRHAVFRPSSQPLVMLADALQKLHPGLTQETLTTQTPKDQISLLLIDQFEELFIQSDASQRVPFCDFLTNLPSFADCRSHILITVRVDYLDELFAIQPLWAIAKEGVELRTMSADDLRNAIQKPLQVNHPQKRFAPELLERLVQDGAADAALLPLLQVTLAELWKTGKLILSNYHSLTDAIRQRAEIVYAFSDHASADPKTPRPTPDQQELMDILLGLINVSVDGTDRRDARQRRTRQEVEQGSAQRPRLIEELINARLLAAANETRNGQDVEVIDIIHESLIDNWARLRNAIKEQRQQLQRRARFKLWLGEWLRNERQDGYLLLTDMQLAEARVLVEAQDIEVQGAAAQGFYQQSLAQQERVYQQELKRTKELAEAQRRRAQTFRWAAIVATILTVFAMAATISALNQRQSARKERDRANQQAAIARSRQLAAQSTSELGNHQFDLALLLAIESGNVTATLESFAAIRAAFAYPWHTRLVIDGATDFIEYVKWSENGHKFLTVSLNGIVSIVDRASGEELKQFKVFPDDSTNLQSIARLEWSRNEQQILTTDSDSIVRIWDIATGTILQEIDETSVMFSDAAWNIDESKILLNSYDGIALIWDVHAAQEIHRLSDVTFAVWNKDSSKILVNYGSTFRILDAATYTELLRLEDVSTAELSPDESKILTRNNEDSAALVLDTVTRKELLSLNEYPGMMSLVKWSPSGNKIFACPMSGEQCSLWDANTGLRLPLQTEGATWLDAVTWSADESKIFASSTQNGTAHIWDSTMGTEDARLTGLSAVAWHPAHDELLTIDSASIISIRTWNAHGGTESLQLERVQTTRWNKDESKLLTAKGDGTVQLWDVNGNELVRLAGHNGLIQQMVWNQDESKLLTSSIDNTVRIWDARPGVNTNRQLLQINDVDWGLLSPDDKQVLVTNEESGSFAIWELADSSRPKVTSIKGQPGRGHQALWHRDSKQVLTVGCAETKETCTSVSFRIWDAQTGIERIQFEGHQGDIKQVSWSKHQDKILTTGEDNTAIIWAAATGKVLVRLAAVRSARWSEDETKVLTTNTDNSASIWIIQAARAKELVKFSGHTSVVWNAVWNKAETKVLTLSADQTMRIWDATTGTAWVTIVAAIRPDVSADWSTDGSKLLMIDSSNSAHIWDTTTGNELARFDAVDSAFFTEDTSKLLVVNSDGALRIQYIDMADLLKAACSWSSRNFNWREWSTYMEGKYHPTCVNAPIPSSAMTMIQAAARQQILTGQTGNATQLLEKLNSWLQINGQFKHYRVDVHEFVAAVSATAAAEGQLSPTLTPTR